MKRVLSAVFAMAVFLCAIPAHASITVTQASGSNLHITCDSGCSGATADPCAANGGSQLSMFTNATASGNTQLVALSSGKAIYICHIWIMSNNGALSMSLEYGTGSACGTGTTELTPVTDLATQYAFIAGNGSGTIIKAPASQAFCLNLTAAGSGHGVGVYLEYVQQ